MKIRALFILLALAVFPVAAQEEALSPERAQQIRERYEQVLTRTPMQDSAFDRVYSGYLEAEGVDAWVAKLKPAEGEPTKENWVLLGRIQERQFKTNDALLSLEKARELGMADTQLDLLLGRLYYENGQDEKAATLLTAALEQPLPPEERSGVARILGNLYLRQGKRDEAIAAWKRIADDNPGDTFAQTELAEIYEDNRMWPEAVATYTALADASGNDPYQKCRALRATGRAHIALEAYPEAIAAFEQALDLVSPGNWLFEDLKMRLVGVYQDLGDLEGLAVYINEKLAANPADTEFRDLLAETYTRMTKFAEAEAEHKKILERDPGRIATHESLIALYERQERFDDVIATYESLIKQYPTEPDYLRQLGEVHLRRNQPEDAKAVWRRLLDATPTASQHAQLAEWLEMHEFAPEAMAEYVAALALEPNREWTFRLAGLKHAGGDGDGAKALWNGLLKEDSPPAERAEVAQIMENFKYIADAEPLLAKAHEQEPANLEFAQALARNRMEQEKFEEALPLFELMTNQTENEYFRDRGEGGLLDVYSKLGVLTEKREEWERAASAEPDNTELLMRLARMYSRSGDTASALALFERCVTLQPENPDYLKSVAEAYVRGGQTTEGIDVYRKLIDVDPNRAGGYYRELLDIYLKADFQNEAIETAQKVVELSPSDAESYLSLGQVNMMYRKTDDALAAYRSALRLEPDEPDYHRQYGQALQQENRLGEAEEAYRKMLDTAKEDDTRLQAVGQLAGIHQRLGRMDGLLEEFQSRVRNTPKRLAAYQELGAIHAQAGDPARSMEVLESAYNVVDDKGAVLKALVRASFEAQDFERVVRYFEELIGMSGKASAFEYERLGQVYAQLGEIDKARSTWQRIVDEDKDNPKAYVTLAKALRDSGFEEEAAAATEAALERDPHNYTLRYEYAQTLAGQEDMGTAYEQLQLLLELGPSEADKEKEKKAEEREKKVQALQRSQPGYERLNMFSASYRPNRNNYYGSGLRSRNFESIRPQVISTMAAMAENSVGIDEFIATYKKRVEDNPASEQAHQDLILVYENCNRLDEAKAALEALAQIRPEDVNILDRLAVQHSYNQEIDKALEILAKIETLQPTRKKANDLARIYLLYRSEKKEEARAKLIESLDNAGTDTNLFYMATNIASEYAEHDLLGVVAEKSKALEPRMARSIQQNLMWAYQRTGAAEKSRAICEEVLFAADDPQDPYSIRGIRGRSVQIYAPRIGENQQNYGRMVGPGAAYYQLQQIGLGGSLDQSRLSAFTQLKTTLEGADQDALIQRMNEEAGRFAAAATKAERDRAWNFGQLLASQYVSDREYAKAREVLAPFIAAKFDDSSAYNLAIYIDEQEDQFDGMLGSYGTLRELYPGKLRDILKAECATLMLAGRHDEAAERIREVAQRSAPPAELVALIRQLKQEDKPKLARQLLEEQLSGLKRNGEALSLLAEICASENDFEQAMKLAREAWESRARSSSGMNSYYYGGYYQSSGMSVDTNLQSMFQYAKSAGKKDELIAEFKQRLEQQPASVTAHEHLASLYSLDGEQDRAIDLYKELIAKRPHFIKAATALAQLYEQAGKYQEALAQYESFVKTRPSLYQGMGWQIRRLYQRMGKGEDLARIEDDLVKQARTPDQLQQLANQFQNDGEFEKAAELYAKVIAMDPNQAYYRTELAEIYREMGREEEALKVYQEWLASPVLRSRGYIDSRTVGLMVGQYKALGRLDELKAQNEVIRIDKPDDPVAKAVESQIAVMEHRFDDATEYLKESVQSGRDSNGIQLLMEIGKYQDNLLTVVADIEKSGQLANYWNGEELAKIYLGAGERQKALDTYQQFADQQGEWGYSQIMDGLYRMGFYAEAEEFYIKNRKKTRRMDGNAMNMYMEGHGFSGLVQEILSGEVNEQVEKIADNIVRDEKTSYERGIEILTPLLERAPENKTLLKQMMDLHVRHGKPEAALTWGEKYWQVNAKAEEHRQGYAQLLIQCNREDDAFKLYDAALDEEVNREVVMAALEFFLAQGHENRGRALRERAAGTLDEKDLKVFDKRLKRQEAGRGYTRAYADQLKADFEAEANDENFSAYLDYLLDAGFDEEAWALAAAQAGTGLITDRVVQRGTLLESSLQYGGPEAAADLVWSFLRHGDRWNQSYYLDQIRGAYSNAGFGRLFTDVLRARALSETPPYARILDPISSGYAEMGDSISGLQTLDALLVIQPKRRPHLVRKASLLQSLKRHDEALALRQSMPGAASLNAEVEDTLALARLFFDMEKHDEAAASIESILVWNHSPGVAMQIGSILMNAGKHAEAIPHLEKSLRDLELRENVVDQLITCYLNTGAPEKALALWRENKKLRQFQSFHQRVDAPIYQPIAREVLEQRTRDFPAEMDAYGRLARLLLKEGDVAGVRELFKRAEAAVSEVAKPQIALTYGAALAASGQLPALLENPPADDLLLARALALGYRDLPKEQRSDVLRDRVLALPVSDVEELTLLAAFFQEQKDIASASALWERALATEGLTSRERIELWKRMVESGARPEVVSDLAVALQAEPGLLNGKEDLTVFIARYGTPELQALSLAQLRSRMPEGDGIAFFEQLAAYHAAGTADPTALLDFASKATLSHSQWRTLARLFNEQGNRDAELGMLRRIADGGFGRDSRDRALAEICVIEAETGRPVEAFADFRLISPKYGDREGLADMIAKHTTVEHIPAMRAGVDESIAAQPGNVLAPDWMGAVAQWAERAGAPINLAEWIGASPLAPVLQSEARQWTRLLEGWQVSPAGSGKDLGSKDAQDAFKATLNAEGAPADLAGWQAIDAAQSLGLVNIGPLFFPEVDKALEETGQSLPYAAMPLVPTPAEPIGACAYRMVESASGGTMDLGFATIADFAEVWVNGQRVHTNQRQPAVRPGIARFQIALKPGANHILVRTAHNNARWLFCLGELEPTAPLEVTAPPAPAPAEAPAIAAAG